MTPTAKGITQTDKQRETYLSQHGYAGGVRTFVTPVPRPAPRNSEFGDNIGVTP
jgi:hypothetical protein